MATGRLFLGFDSSAQSVCSCTDTIRVRDLRYRAKQCRKFLFYKTIFVDVVHKKVDKCRSNWLINYLGRFNFSIIRWIIPDYPGRRVDSTNLKGRAQRDRTKAPSFSTTAKLRWNSWTVVLVEVSRHKLEPSQIWVFVWFSILIFPFYKTLFMNRL